MSDTIKTECPGCKTRLSVSAAHAGKSLKCPKCSAAVQVSWPLPHSLDIHVPETGEKLASIAARSFGEALRKRATWVDLVTAAIVSNPLKFLGAALAFGVLLGACSMVSNAPPTTATIDTPSPPTRRLKNAIRSIEAESLEDPEFVDALTPINKHLIIRIRNLAIVADFQCDESYLGECFKDEITTVVFDRPEASYWIAAYTNSDKSFAGYLYPSSSEISLDNLEEYYRRADGEQFEFGDMVAAKDALRRGGLAAALLMEPDPAKQGDIKLSASALLNSPEIDRLLEPAINGQKVDIEFECGPLLCQVVGMGYPAIRFRRPH